MRHGSKFETIEELEEELHRKELRNKIAKMDEKALKQKILIGISAVGSFLVVTFLFSHYLLASSKPSDYNLSAALSLVAGFFAAFLIMAISGIIKEFSIKSGLIEVSSKIEQKIENVQTNVEESKKELEEKISLLNQNVALSIQSIDNKIANMNQIQNMQQLASNTRMGFRQNLNLSLSQEQMIKAATTKAKKQIKSLEDRDTDDILQNAPTASTDRPLVRQKAIEGNV
jgi:hypothetical protein